MRVVLVREVWRLVVGVIVVTVVAFGRVGCNAPMRKGDSTCRPVPFRANLASAGRMIVENANDFDDHTSCTTDRPVT
jgi:hypothetical protein